MKNMELLIDTNIVIDWALDRKPFANDARELINLCVQGLVNGHLAGHTLLNFFYITRKDLPLEKRKNFLQILCEHFWIVDISADMVLEVLEWEHFRDLEDDLQIKCAQTGNVDYIITRDSAGFANAGILTLSPNEFLKMQRMGGKTNELGKLS